MSGLPKEVHNEILLNLQKLILLRLPGSPPADGIELTVAMWIDALSSLNEKWQADDVLRIKHAFGRLIVECEKWPAPKTLIRHLPPRKIRLVPRLERKKIWTQEELNNNRRKTAEILKMLNKQKQFS